MHLTTNQMYVLNRTAARLWDLVCAGHGRADIVRTIGEEFEVDEAALGDEVEEVLASMTRDELITPCDRS